MQKNRIYSNEGIGFYLKDVSRPKKMTGNEVRFLANNPQFNNNLIEISCQGKNMELEQFFEFNDAHGDIRLYHEERCTLI
jgi:hypothetical protein